jgi:hypothetical protein
MFFTPTRTVTVMLMDRMSPFMSITMPIWKISRILPMRSDFRMVSGLATAEAYIARDPHECFEAGYDYHPCQQHPEPISAPSRRMFRMLKGW